MNGMPNRAHALQDALARTGGRRVRAARPGRDGAGVYRTLAEGANGADGAGESGER